MGKLRALGSVLIAWLVACGDDGGSVQPDASAVHDAALDAAPDAFIPDAFAPSYDFSCHQNEAPTTAAATVEVSGTAQEIYLDGLTPSVRNAGGVLVQACRGDCTGPDDLGTTGPTGPDGVYTTNAVSTGGVPLDGYVIASKAGSWSTYLYPPSPLTQNEAGVPILMLTEALIPLLGFAGIERQPGTGMLAVMVTDCSVPPVGIVDATVTVTQNGAPVGDPPVSPGSALGSQGEGVFLVADVPPGEVEVSATYMGMTFRVHTVGSFADALTTTQVKPGY